MTADVLDKQTDQSISNACSLLQQFVVSTVSSLLGRTSLCQNKPLKRKTLALLFSNTERSYPPSSKFGTVRGLKITNSVITIPVWQTAHAFRLKSPCEPVRPVKL